MQEKTNAIRVATAHKAEFESFFYEAGEALSGNEVAKKLGIDEKNVFKTLVCEAKGPRYYVFMLPVSSQLDLKKAALSVNEKSVGMLKQKDLFPLTGYVHGGCSPIGMKKQFVSVIDESARYLEFIVFSAGKIGAQMKMPRGELERIIPLIYAPLCKE